MNPANFRGVDLNLLIVLATVMQHRNTTRAAESLYLTQPAVSHALKRMRKLFGDELFVRTSRGLAPTPRAEELVRELIPAMSQIERLVRRSPQFDPARAERDFRVGLPSALDVCVTPALLEKLAAQVPRSNLIVRPTSLSFVADQLDSDEVQVAMTVMGELRPWHVKEEVGTYGYSCLFDGKRLRLRAPVSIKRFLGLPHVLTSFRGDRWGVVDDALQRRKLKRRVLAASADFASVAMYLKSTDTLAVMPEYAARRFARLLDLTVSPVPIELPPLKVSMAWHRKYSDDGAVRWLREAMRDACRKHC